MISIDNLLIIFKLTNQLNASELRQLELRIKIRLIELAREEEVL